MDYSQSHDNWKELHMYGGMLKCTYKFKYKEGTALANPYTTVPPSHMNEKFEGGWLKIEVKGDAWVKMTGKI